MVEGHCMQVGKGAVHGKGCCRGDVSVGGQGC